MSKKKKKSKEQSKESKWARKLGQQPTNPKILKKISQLSKYSQPEK